MRNKYMQIKPLRDLIAIERDAEEHTTTSGIVLIHTRNVGKGCFTGTVVACGPGCEIDGKHDEIVVKPGDRVAYSKNTGVIHEIDGNKVLFVKQRDLMGFVRD
jgi:chaperonin GroES